MFMSTACADSSNKECNAITFSHFHIYQVKKIYTLIPALSQKIKGPKMQLLGFLDPLHSLLYWCSQLETSLLKYYVSIDG